MQTDGVQSFATVAALNLVCHIDIRSLALAVGAPWAVSPLFLKLIVIEVDAVRAVTGRRQADDAGVEIGRRGFKE